jgi:ribosomal protein S18 acetylase RimI-like enzyme
MISYRKANLEDIHSALVLWFKIWDIFIVPNNAPKNPDYDEITQNSGLLKKYESGERFMLVATDGDKIVGVIGADANGNVIRPPVCVDNEYQRQGIATELLRQMVCELKATGFDCITVDSSEYALPFYKNFGFFQIGAEQQHKSFVSIPMKYTPNEI